MAPEPKAEATEPQAEVADVGPQAVAKAKRNLPTGRLTRAPQVAPTPVPPVKPQAVAELEQPNIASDASPEAPRSAARPKLFSPLPPRRPADLAALAFADMPMPPMRPAV